MTTVSVSSKFQIVIPKEIRESMRIEEGMKLEMIPYDGHIELIPVISIKDLRGFLKGMDADIVREQDRL